MSYVFGLKKKWIVEIVERKNMELCGLDKRIKDKRGKWRRDEA